MQSQWIVQRCLLVVTASSLFSLLGARAQADDLVWQTPRIAHRYEATEDRRETERRTTTNTKRAKRFAPRLLEVDGDQETTESGIAPQRLRRGTSTARRSERSSASFERAHRIATDDAGSRRRGDRTRGQEHQNQTVAYHEQSYPSEPWHPHPSYSSYGRGGSRHSRVWGRQASAPGRFALDSSDEIFDGGNADPWVEGDGFSSCGDCGNCDACYGPSLLVSSFSIGVQGFKGPTDLGRNGNFGINESFNFGFPLFNRFLGGQFGARFTQNNFSGDQATGAYRDGSREQTFITAGLFHRADDCCPWQGGVVIDWFHDNYWYESDLAQARFELSRVTHSGLELGIMATFGTGDDTNVLQLNTLTGLEATDMYTLFARIPTDSCGEWRVWGGATSHGDGLVGSDFTLPILHAVALEGNFNYLFASESRSASQAEDSFGIGLNLTWYPGRSARSALASPFRPLFSVADNARFMVDRK